MHSTYARSACTAVSHPYSTPTPTCFGLSCSASLEVAWQTPKRPVCLRNTLPTATGRTSPSVFLKATNYTPSIAPQAKSGTLPLRIRLAIFVMALRSLRPSSSSSWDVNCFKKISLIHTNPEAEKVGIVCSPLTVRACYRCCGGRGGLGI